MIVIWYYYTPLVVVEHSLWSRECAGNGLVYDTIECTCRPYTFLLVKILYKLPSVWRSDIPNDRKWGYAMKLSWVAVAFSEVYTLTFDFTLSWDWALDLNQRITWNGWTFSDYNCGVLKVMCYEWLGVLNHRMWTHFLLVKGTWPDNFAKEILFKL